MEVWELDFYRRPVFDDSGQPLWELLICTSGGNPLLSEFCPAARAGAVWLRSHLEQLVEAQGGPPLEVHVFRQASFNLASPVCRTLGIPLRRARRTIALQRWLAWRGLNVYPLDTGYHTPPYSAPAPRSVPVPFPVELLPEEWGFSALPAPELAQIAQLPIEYLALPLVKQDWEPYLASTTVPGVFLFGKSARPLARWLDSHEPVALAYTEAELSGLVLDAGPDERWVLATFNDPQMQAGGRQFAERQQQAGGLHFLAVQPGQDGDITGFWLLQTPAL
ncbi:MAG: DUF1092 family protein [Gemmatimonadaceae bacterium]|nr:DUF1092 family protein [Gloeobacterales cyanobacterium ES-bin-141]